MAKNRSGGKRENGSRAVDDVAARRLVEELERELDEQWRSLVQNIPDIILTVDAGGAITFINRTVPGLTVEKVIGTTVFEYLPPDQHDTMRDLLGRVLDSGEVNRYESAAAGPFGSTSWYLSRIGPVVRDGKVVAAVLIVTDITERRRTEQALRGSEERYRQLVEDINDIVFAVDATGRITYISPVVTDVGGYSPSEMVGRSFAEFLHPGDVPAAVEGFQRSVQGDHEPSELRFLSKSGEVHWLRSFGRPILDGDRVVGLRGVLTDVTDLKRIEEALRESEARFRSAFEHAATGMAIVAPDGRILQVNRVCCQLLGYSEQELTSTSWQSISHPDDLGISRDYTERVLAGEIDSFELEKRYLRKDGSAIWGHLACSLLRDGEGRPLYLVSQIQDISDRKRAEEALRQSERRYRDLVENINEAIYELDAEGRVTYISPAVEETSGFSPAEIVGRAFTDFVHADDFSALVERFREGIAGTPEPIEFRLTFKSGEIRWARSSGRPIREGERIVGFRGVLSDITDRRLAEEELRKSQETLLALLNAPTESAMLVDRDGTIVALNRIAAERFGKSVADLVGTCGFELLGPDVRSLRKRKFDEVFRSGKPVRFEDERAGIWFDATIYPIFNSQHEVTRLAVFATDMTERKQMEEALRESEERYRRLADNAPDIIFRHRFLPTPAYEYVSPAIDRIVGYSPEEFYADPNLAMKIVHPDDREKLQAMIKDPSTDRGTLRWIRRDGAVIWTEHRNVPIYDEDGSLVAVEGIVRDTTERERAEETLREREEKYRDLVENINEVIYELDPSGRITYMSPAVEHLGGFTASEMTGRNFSEFVHPDDVLDLAQSFWRDQMNRQGRANEWRGVSKGGGTVWIRSHGRVIVKRGRVVGYRGILVDITERKLAEEALRESEERYRDLVESSPYAMAVHSEGKIAFVNSAGVQILGAKASDQIIGRPVWDFVHADKVEAVRKRILSAQLEPGEVDLAEEKLVRLDGQVLDVEMAAIPIIYQGGAARQVLLRDITENKRMEEALQHAREELESIVERQMEPGTAYGLTFREMTVLHLMADGKSDREIATILGISTLTAQKHVENIRAKMRASSRTEASVRAVRERLLD